MNEKRRKHAAYLNQRLKCKEIELPVEAPGRRHVYQMYTIKLKGVERDAFVWGLREKNIMASVHFDPPVHLHKYYTERAKTPVSLPVTEQLSRSIVTLPMYPQLSRKELDYMVKSVHQVLGQLKKM